MDAEGSRVTESKKHTNYVELGQKLHCAGTALWLTPPKNLYHQGRQDK